MMVVKKRDLLNGIMKQVIMSKIKIKKIEVFLFGGNYGTNKNITYDNGNSPSMFKRQ
jgi:hypothetical protein